LEPSLPRIRRVGTRRARKLRGDRVPAPDRRLAESRGARALRRAPRRGAVAAVRAPPNARSDAGRVASDGRAANRLLAARSARARGGPLARGRLRDPTRGGVAVDAALLAPIRRRRSKN